MRRQPLDDFSWVGPGPLTPAVKAIVFSNIAVFLITFAAPDLITGLFGLTPRLVLEQGRIWQLATYLFVHSPVAFSHILFNMLYVWLFGVELERRWGTQAFVRYYFITGVGAGLCVLVAALLPLAAAQRDYYATTIGASGAVYGLILAWVLTFPHRTIMFMMIFPMKAWVFGLIMGALVFFSAVGGGASGISHLAHAGGLIIGYLYLKGPRQLRLQLQYQLTRWRMQRLRRRFDVHKGGRFH